MLPLYDLLDGVRTVLLGDHALVAWAQANYKRELKVWIGNRKIEHIPVDSFPLILCVADDTPYNEDRMMIGLAVYNHNVDVALRELSDFNELVLATLGRDTGWVFDVTQRHHDSDMYHPIHSLSLAVTVHAIDNMLAGTPVAAATVAINPVSQRFTYNGLYPYDGSLVYQV